VKFAINGGSTGGQRPYVILYRPDQSLLGTVYLPDIIGTIASNTWYQVSIPLSSFATNATIGEFSIESPTATTIYLDDIRLEGHAQGSAATRYTYDHTGQRTSYFDGSATRPSQANTMK
jgi:hypothetical protein